MFHTDYATYTLYVSAVQLASFPGFPTVHPGLGSTTPTVSVRFMAVQFLIGCSMRFYILQAIKN